MKFRRLPHRIRSISLGLAVFLVLGFGGLGLYNSWHGQGASSDSECTASAHNSVITVFYRSGTSPDTVNNIIASTHARQRDIYPQKHAFSMLASTSSQSTVVATLRNYPEVTNVQVSAAQGCIDPN